ncbi:MAG: response regulator transcription factor [Acidobacteria bacterium]|nr:response regulator transcription factor [Acidobacteriota bacterium]
MKPYILIVEDDPDLAEGIRYNLDRTGAFTVQVAASGEDALRYAFPKTQERKGTGSLQTVSLFILDLNLPGMSGFELCRRFRSEEATRNKPILMLTARTEENDKVKGLELGADDYMTKPFSVRELVARVKALLRRAGYEEAAPEAYDDGQLKVDYGAFTAYCSGAEIKLTRKELALLVILTRTPGRVIPREKLLDEVWGMQYYGEARTLDVHISGLRKKLGECGQRIETVIGIGYRLRVSETEKAATQ